MTDNFFNTLWILHFIDNLNKVKSNEKGIFDILPQCSNTAVAAITSVSSPPLLMRSSFWDHIGTYTPWLLESSMPILLTLIWILQVSKRYLSGHQLCVHPLCLPRTLFIVERTEDGTLQAGAITLEQGIEIPCSFSYYPNLEWISQSHH